jgi:hypothetical protein
VVASRFTGRRDLLEVKTTSVSAAFGSHHRMVAKI